KISELAGKNTAIATMSYSWVQNPRAGVTNNNSLVSGVDFALIDGDDVLVGLSHTHFDALDRISSGDNVSQIAVKGGKLLENSTSLVMAERGFKYSKIIADEMTIKVGIKEQTVNLGFREAAKTVIRHVEPSLK
ncbi:MAG: hypothetical protein K2X47_14385, partial [Bdellovibrionales bacterium]|nr:hypothetical protein [Bdellovibrionales bacterium]